MKLNEMKLNEIATKINYNEYKPVSYIELHDHGGTLVKSDNMPDIDSLFGKFGYDERIFRYDECEAIYAKIISDKHIDILVLCKNENLENIFFTFLYTYCGSFTVSWDFEEGNIIE